MDNAQKHNIYMNVPLLQTFRSYIVWTVIFGVRCPGHVARAIKECIGVSGRETS
jgi:hypothetical protein